MADIRLLLHCNGTDGSTSFPDDSGQNHTMTANGTAQVDTDQKKYGTGALQLDGDSDDLSTPDSADWDIFGSNSDDWTISFFFRSADGSIGNEFFVQQREDAENQWRIRHDPASGGFQLNVYQNNVLIISLAGAGSVTDTNWHHLALCKIANEYALYLDGQQINYVQDDSTDTLAGSLYIGSNATAAAFFNGHMDEIWIIHTNYFNASPQSDNSDTITVPTKEYVKAGGGFLFNLI